MGKVYILQQTIEMPDHVIEKGCEKTIPEWCVIFPNMWGEDFEDYKNWFLPKEENKANPHDIDVQNAIAMLVADGYKIISPKENKSNDSFQWTEACVKALLWSKFQFPEGVIEVQSILEEFKKEYIKNHSQKRQAEKVAVYHGRQESKDEFDAEIRQAMAYYGANNLLCEECGLIATHKKTCSKADNKPDWEIVAFEKNGVVYSITNDGLYDTDDLPFTDRKSKEDLIRTGYNIKSVKRLSDNITFSVGDKVIHRSGKEIGNSKILKFVIPEVLKTLMWFEFEEGKDWCKDLANFTKHPPQPQKEEQKIDVDEPLGITMREIASCITNYVRKSDSPFLRDNETTVIDHKKLEEICKTKMRKMFTKQQADAMCEDAFNAARSGSRHLSDRDGQMIGGFTYPTFQDYKNKQSKQ